MKPYIYLAIKDSPYDPNIKKGDVAVHKSDDGQEIWWNLTAIERIEKIKPSLTLDLCPKTRNAITYFLNPMSKHDSFCWIPVHPLALRFNPKHCKMEGGQTDGK